MFSRSPRREWQVKDHSHRGASDSTPQRYSCDTLPSLTYNFLSDIHRRKRKGRERVEDINKGIARSSYSSSYAKLSIIHAASSTGYTGFLPHRSSFIVAIQSHVSLLPSLTPHPDIAKTTHQFLLIPPHKQHRIWCILYSSVPLVGPSNLIASPSHHLRHHITPLDRQRWWRFLTPGWRWWRWSLLLYSLSPIGISALALQKVIV